MLTIIGFIISILIVVTQVAARRGRVDPDIAFSVTTRIFFALIVLSAILILSFSHVSGVKGNSNWYVALKSPYNYDYLRIGGVLASRISVFALTLSFLSLIPLVHHIYQRAHPRRLFSMLGQSLASSDSPQKLSQRFGRIRRHLLAFASSDEVSSFESGLTALEESVRSILDKSNKRAGSSVADELGNTLRKLSENVRDNDVLLKRLARHQVTCARIFAKENYQESIYFIKKVRVILGKNLVWWYDGELSHTAGIRSMSAVVDLAEICSEHKISVSFANESKSLSNCVGQMISTGSGRALTASFSGITKISYLSMKYPLLNIDSIIQNYSKSIEYLAENDERPSIPEYRIRESASPILYMISSGKKHGVEKDILSSVSSLKTQEFKPLINEMYEIEKR